MVAVALIIGAGGGVAINAIQINAQNTTPTPTTSKTQVTPKVTNRQVDTSKGGHVGANGKREELLTGNTAEKAKAAALIAVPGGTVDRVETDAEGAVYEAHMTKSDGTRVTVKFDSNFKVTATEAGRK